MKTDKTITLEVNGQPWEYKIGRNSISIYDTQGNPYHVKFTEIIGDKIFDLNEEIILEYIFKKIIGEKPKYLKCSNCNLIKPDVYLRTNPYSIVINHDYTKHNLCNDCCYLMGEEI